ncbi:glycosyltransferase family 2 protein [Aquiflexum sp.]|uniref:glycosyltransferase family 2 protein n=1 Tax=Aquiflexum sp. TaxID=1872584 RepID=UPI0035930FE4
MLPLTSVIIPCYNQALFLEETVNSVLNSNYSNFEIIIVDDGSHDHSAKIALKIHEKHPEKIHVIMQENAGPANARNVGIKAARGKYILPLDGNDKISKDYIEEAVTIFEKNQNVKVVYCEAEKFGDKSGQWKLKPFSRKALALDNMIFVSALYRKSDWERCGGYDPRMTWGEDWEFWINMLKSGGEVVKLPITGFYYRIREGSRRKSTDKEAKQKTIDLINEKHIDFLKEQIGGPLRNPRSLSEVINKVSGWF